MGRLTCWAWLKGAASEGTEALQLQTLAPRDVGGRPGVRRWRAADLPLLQPVVPGGGGGGARPSVEAPVGLQRHSLSDLIVAEDFCLSADGGHLCVCFAHPATGFVAVSGAAQVERSEARRSCKSLKPCGSQYAVVGTKMRRASRHLPCSKVFSLFFL